MKLKKSLLSILLILMIFIGINRVSADSFKLSVNGTENYNGINIFRKSLGSHPAFCISGMSVSAVDGTTCNMNNSGFTDAQRAIMGQIINKGCGSDGCADFENSYVVTEVAIMQYLQEIGKNIVSIDESNHATLASKANSLVSQAKDATTIDVYQASNFNVEFNKDSLIFTKSGDVYKSQTIKLNKIPQVEKSTINLKVSGVTGAKIVGDYTSFHVEVPVANITQDSTITLETGTVKQKKYVMGRVYNCSSGQDVTRLITNQRTGSDTIKGTIAPKGSLTVNKVDEKGQPVKGAQIKITGPNNYSQQYVTDGTSKTFNNLAFGTYTIQEIKAPDGYIIAKNITVTLSSTVVSQTVSMKDDENEVKISKLDVTGKSELPGATLEVQDEKGKIVKYCKDANGNKGAECKWVSTTQPYVIEGMPSGKYYLVETIAPNGYVLSKEKVMFEVKDNVAVTNVKMTNKLNKVEISKISVATKKELPGATLEIQDKDGKIVKYCTDAKGNKNTECKWISTDKPYVIEGMPNGTYYLVETIAPDGYVLNKEKVQFTVDNTKSETEVVKVEMKNELEVDVPDTLSSRSTLLLTIAMIDIALGIGIVTYVKKNKITQ